MAFSKKKRQQVYDMCGGHCAYCGREIAFKDMQIDHLKAKYLQGSNDIENLLPSCRMCNFRKGTLSIDQFRKEIQQQADGVCKTFQGRMSLAYGLIEKIDKPIVFYFEKQQNEQD